MTSPFYDFIWHSVAATEVTVPDENGLLELILDSWDRNNRILVNLVHALPPGGLEARVMAGR